MKQFLKEQRLPEKNILFIDNASSPLGEEELRAGNIFIRFMLRNVTALLQSMDQGVIEATRGVIKIN